MSEPIVDLIWQEGADRSLPLPAYRTAGAAGADICANFLPEQRAEGVTLPPGGWALIPTGFCIAVPAGFELQLRPRSGLALKHGITLANSPGTVDADYRGALGVIVLNAGAQAFIVTHGLRIAQVVLAPVLRGTFRLAQELDQTARGAGGFGSTGEGQ